MTNIGRTQFRVAPFSNDEVPEWGNDAENCIDYTPYTFRDFLHHTLMTNKDAVSSEEAIIFQLPRVLVVEQEKSTVFVQMREHNREKNGLTVLFVRIIPAGDDEEDVKAEREQVEGEEDVMVDDEDDDQWTDEEYNAFEEVGEHGFGWSYGDEEEEEEEEELEGEEGDSDIAAEDAEDGGDNEGDAGEGAEGGFEFEGGLFNLLNYAGGGFGSLNGGGHAGGESSSYSLPYNNTQEDDGNARPYCFRSPR
ncbi:hypothetical protein BGW39_009041 [Mortierella sp. 14UC]|nr:hypothetical protein BGW39_009041 [Mortierella sp. 14UC]